MVGVASAVAHRLVAGPIDSRKLERRDEPRGSAGEALSRHEQPLFCSLDGIFRPVPAVFYSCIWNCCPCDRFQPEEHPQGRGAWHLHCVFIFAGKAPYMENAVVRDCWKQGFVTVKRLDDVDNVGAYLTAYLGDMELSEASKADMAVSYSKGIKEVEYEDENGVKQTKKYIKGARLCMYPPGFHIFRWSKGIKKPDVSVVEYKKAKEKASSGKLTFTKTVALEDPESDFKNTLQYEYYNSMRK